MTQKHPLCLYNGDIKELQASDSLVDHEVFNVKDYGAVGDGSLSLDGAYTVLGTDNTTAFQNAINDACAVVASYGYDDVISFTARKIPVVYIPSGIYRINSQLTINKGIAILGDASTVILCGHSLSNDIFYCSPASTFNSPYNKFSLQKMCIRNITITTGILTNVKTTGYGIRIRRSINFELQNIRIKGFANGIHIEGCVDSHISNIVIEATNVVSSLIANSALLRLSPLAKEGGEDSFYSPIFTTSISDFTLKGGGRVEHCLLIEAGDGVAFSNGYINHGYTSLLRICPKNVLEATLSGVLQFTNVYFDGIWMVEGGVETSVGATWDIMIVSNTYGSIGPVYFNSCHIGEVQNGVNIIGNFVDSVSFVNCSFGWTKYYNFVTSSTTLMLSIIGCYFYRSSLQAPISPNTYSALTNFTNIKKLSITDCSFVNPYDWTNCAIFLAGTISESIISNNSFFNMGNGSIGGDIINTATITTFSQTGNTTTRTALASKFPGVIDAKTGFTVNGAVATQDYFLKGNGTSFISSAGANLSISGNAAPFTLSVPANNECLVKNATLTIGLSGQLGVANGGTGVSTLDDGYAIKARGQQNFSIFPIFDSGSNISLGYSTYTRTVSIAGITSITNTTVSSTTATGALVVAGGVGIGGTLRVAGNIYSTLDIYTGRDIYIPNNKSLYLTKSGGAYTQFVTMTTTDSCLIAQSVTGNITLGTSCGGNITIGSGATAANPITIRVGSADKNVTARTAAEMTGYKYLAVPA